MIFCIEFPKTTWVTCDHTFGYSRQSPTQDVRGKWTLQLNNVPILCDLIGPRCCSTSTHTNLRKWFYIVPQIGPRKMNSYWSPSLLADILDPKLSSLAFFWLVFFTHLDYQVHPSMNIPRKRVVSCLRSFRLCEYALQVHHSSRDLEIDQSYSVWLAAKSNTKLKKKPYWKWQNMFNQQSMSMIWLLVHGILKNSRDTKI